MHSLLFLFVIIVTYRTSKKKRMKIYWYCQLMLLFLTILPSR